MNSYFSIPRFVCVSSVLAGGCAPCRGSGFGRVPLAHIPIAHIHSHCPVLRVFLLDHQSENFILN